MKPGGDATVGSRSRRSRRFGYGRSPDAARSAVRSGLLALLQELRTVKRPSPYCHTACISTVQTVYRDLAPLRDLGSPLETRARNGGSERQLVLIRPPSRPPYNTLMFGQGDERDTLLIDRAAAAEVPREDSVREWARDKRAFISSVMEELREERMAAADSVGSLGARPVMFEEFGGRDADPVDAYLGEVETSQIYVGILGQRYGRPLGTRFSATHTEFRHAEQQGLRVAAWALDTQEREGPQQAFLDEVRTFHVVPAFGSPADLRRQVTERLRGIAAEDLAPWTKLGCILFRASEVTHEGDQIAVTARVQSDDVAHALETLTPDNFGVQGEHRFTWSRRCRHVRVANVRTTTTTARSRLMHLQLEVVEGHRDHMLGVAFNGLTPDDLTDVALRAAVFGDPNPLARQHMDFMAEMADPFQPLREARVPDEIVRALAEVMIVDELVGSGRAARVTTFRLGASVGGWRRLELAWEPPRRYANERRERGQPLVGQVRL